MKAAIIIEPDGSVRELSRAREIPTLEELQAAVGGYIEVVRLTGKTILVVDEEGLLKERPLNPLATALYGHGPIVGTVILCDSAVVP